MKHLKNIINTFSIYSKVVDGISRILIFVIPTKGNWSSLAQPTEDCPIYAYRERDDGGYNQIPIDDLTIDNTKEIVEVLDLEFGSNE